MPKRRVGTPEMEIDGEVVLADFAVRSAEARAESSDETIAGTTHGAGDAETSVVPELSGDMPELAWSLYGSGF